MGQGEGLPVSISPASQASERQCVAILFETGVSCIKAPKRQLGDCDVAQQQEPARLKRRRRSGAA